MKDIHYTSRFKRDIRRITKRGKDLDKLKNIVNSLRNGETLPVGYRLHKLQGEWNDF